MRTLSLTLLLLMLSGIAMLQLAAQTSGGDSIAGRYRLTTDNRLIEQTLELEFYRSDEPPADADERLPPSLSGIWNARIVALPDSGKPENASENDTATCMSCPEPLRGQPLLGLTVLSGLRERPAGNAREFLYGRLYLNGQPRPLRCKLWRAPSGPGLFLRIYEPGPASTRRYSTHRLQPAGAADS